jgi:hypothetical protein
MECGRSYHFIYLCSKAAENAETALGFAKYKHKCIKDMLASKLCLVLTKL